MELDKKLILEYQQNRDPYLMIDHASEVVPGKKAIGYKNLNEDEWFFKVHWPGDPNMPGMLQLEALTQMCALAIFTLPENKGKKVYLTNINSVRFFSKVTPSNKLLIDTKVNKFHRGLAECNGHASIGEKIVCKAEFNLILP